MIYKYTHTYTYTYTHTYTNATNTVPSQLGAHRPAHRPAQTIPHIRASTSCKTCTTGSRPGTPVTLAWEVSCENAPWEATLRLTASRSSQLS